MEAVRCSYIAVTIQPSDTAAPNSVWSYMFENYTFVKWKAKENKKYDHRNGSNRFGFIKFEKWRVSGHKYNTANCIWNVCFLDCDIWEITKTWKISFSLTCYRFMAKRRISENCNVFGSWTSDISEPYCVSPKCSCPAQCRPSAHLNLPALSATQRML
jgi:hypothetical protein